jgi:hypothetical protein
MEREESDEALPCRDDDGHSRRFQIGCSGWFYWHWSGAFYPAELPTRGWFKDYAGRSKTVELNPFLFLADSSHRQFLGTTGWAP